MLRDSVNPEVRDFINQFTRSCKKDQQTNTDRSFSEENVKVKEVFLKLPLQEIKQPYLRISKTPTLTNQYTDVIVSKVLSELESRNTKKQLSIQNQIVSISIAPSDYIDDDSFIRQIQQTLLSPNKPKAPRSFERFDERQKKFQVQKEQKLQKQREAQQLGKLVEEFKCYLLRTQRPF